MLNPASIDHQYKQTSEDDVRVLVVGAGIAGITAAQMLRKDGRHPVLIERDVDHSHPGYMLALMPMADAALDDLEVRKQYRDKYASSTVIKALRWAGTPFMDIRARRSARIRWQTYSTVTVIIVVLLAASFWRC